MDRKKIIKGLETCYCPPSKCEDCPYYDLEDEQKCNDCNDTLCLDALALLKEQEAEYVNNIAQQIFCFSGTCPKCGKMLNTTCNKNFCGECGQAVKWEC